MMDLNNL